MKILVTGVAGFIGFHLVQQLVKQAHSVTGIDNLNDYYDIQLKYDRLNELGLNKEGCRSAGLVTSSLHSNLQFKNASIENGPCIMELFAAHNFEVVINLAAQAGVRYSIDNPQAYIKSNIQGFLNILEACRAYPVKHLIYASSSSVYGLNEEVPFSPGNKADQPVSLYAATKKSNELMAHAYHHLFKFPVTGLRFFTVYGPWGRPDMAYYSFTKQILDGREIKIFNNGHLMRDFTYIDDVVDGIIQLMNKSIEEPARFGYKIYNIGNNKPVKLIDFIETLEELLQKQAIKVYLPMQPGDVLTTYADISDSQNDFGYNPATNIREGLAKFVNWYVKHSIN